MIQVFLGQGIEAKVSRWSVCPGRSFAGRLGGVGDCSDPGIVDLWLVWVFVQPCAGGVDADARFRARNSI